MPSNNYFNLVLKDNRLTAVAEFSVGDGNSYIPKAFLDTGCKTSLIPARYLYGTYLDYKNEAIKTFMREEKKKAIEAGYPTSHVVGIGMSLRSQTNKLSFEDIMEDKSVVFCRRVSNFTLNGCKIPDSDLWFSYDIQGTVLLGFDVLSKLHHYMGVGKSGDFHLIASTSINDDYLRAIDKEFGLATTFGAYSYREFIRSIR